MKDKYILACTGHIDLSRMTNFDELRARGKIRAHIQELSKDFEVDLYCGLAYGADSLFAEEALSCGIKLYAVLPCEKEEFADEQPDGGKLFNQLISRAFAVFIKKDDNARYLGVSKFIVNRCDELMAIWNGEELPLTNDKGEPINLGGTYHTILIAKEKGKAVRTFS